MGILQMSVQAGLLIAAILLIRAVALYRLPKTSFLVLWGVVLARMLLPVSISSRWSVYSLFGRVVHTSAPAGRAVIVLRDAAQVQGQLGNTAEHAAGFPVSPLLAVWLGGMAVLVLVFTVSFLKNYRKFRFSIPVEPNLVIEEWASGHRPLRILRSDRVTTPVTLGILRPRVILPKGMDTGDRRLMRYVLTHEYIHIRRLDALWKLLAVCAVCVHWFNPLAWVMLFFLNRDLEISCDEVVLRQLGGNERAAYAQSLLDVAGRGREVSLIHSCFSRNATEETKERIIAIMKYKKASVLSMILAAVTIVGLTTAFAASASEQPSQTAETAPDGNGEWMMDYNFADRTGAEVNGLPFSAEEISCVEGVAAEHTEINGHMAVYTNNGGTWNVKGGQFVRLTFRLDSVDNEDESWRMYLGYVKDGVYEGAIASGDSVSPAMTLDVYVPEDGEYNFFCANISADALRIKSCSISVLDSGDSSSADGGAAQYSEVTKRVHPITGDVSWMKIDLNTGAVLTSHDEGQTWQISENLRAFEME